MRIIVLIIMTVITFSCSDDDNTNSELIGNWELIELLADPGGGEGMFYTVESDKVIRFYADGTISSNGNICDMSVESDNPTAGTFSEVKGKFTSGECNNPEYEYSFEKTDNILIINYPCFEPCKAKYRKL